MDKVTRLPGFTVCVIIACAALAGCNNRAAGPIVKNGNLEIYNQLGSQVFAVWIGPYSSFPPATVDEAGTNYLEGSASILNGDTKAFSLPPGDYQVSIGYQSSSSSPKYWYTLQTSGPTMWEFTVVSEQTIGARLAMSGWSDY
jgi:hypothetical protein